MKKTNILKLVVGLITANICSAAVFSGETVVNSDWRWNNWMGYYYTVSEPWIWSQRYDDWLWVDPSDEENVYSDNYGTFFAEFGKDYLPYLYLSGVNDPIVYNPVSPALSPDTVTGGTIRTFSFSNVPSGQSLDHSDAEYTIMDSYYPVYNYLNVVDNWAAWSSFYDFVEEDDVIEGTHMLVRAPVVSAAGTSTAYWGVKIKVEITDGPYSGLFRLIGGEVDGGLYCDYNGYQVVDMMTPVVWQSRPKGGGVVSNWPEGATEVFWSFGSTWVNFTDLDPSEASNYADNYEYRIKITNYAGTLYSDWIEIDY